MKQPVTKKSCAASLLFSGLLLSHNVYSEDSFTSAVTAGKPTIDMRLRYESAEQNNALDDAAALTLRTRLGYTTGSYAGMSATLEFEDVRIVGGVSDYTVGPTGFNPGEYSVVADPQMTELDQGFVQYKSDLFVAKLGRQVITFDGHRFVGHVGWRQDRQTFDALRLTAMPAKGLTINYANINRRNRIFAEAADVSSEDNLLNVAYKFDVAKLSAYAYLLEMDNNTDNALDTVGFSFSGKSEMDGMKLLYHAEYASQSSETATTEFDASYTFIEGGLVVSGITAKLGYEVLGSDSGAFGFSTPLATLHKFNGWTDQFLGTPAQGLVDTYVSFGGKLGSGKWALVYHDFSADEASATVDDLGSELGVVYKKKFAKIYNAGIKYASYSAGDAAANKVDTDKLWVWAGMKF